MNKILSFRYDYTNGFGDFLPNGLSENLVNLLYTYPIHSIHDDWNLYSQMPTWYSWIPEHSKNCKIKYNNKKSSEPILDNEECYYVISPAGSGHKFMGIQEPHIPFTENIKPDTLHKLSSGDFKLIIDHSLEGNPDQHFKILHNILANKKIKPQNVTYITSNLIVNDLYDRWIKKSKVDPITMFGIPYFEALSANIYNLSKNDSSTFYQIDHLYDNINKIRDYYFLCLNRRPHSHRHALMCLLLKENLIKMGLISWPQSKVYDTGEDFTWRDLQFVVDNNHLQEFEFYSEQLKKISPLIIDSGNFSTNWAYGYEMSNPYKQTYFSVVTETLYSDPDSIFFSEKIWKPIANFHPFILVSSYNSLKKLKELGYKTFNPYINESYDQINDPTQRLIEIAKEVKRLCTMPKKEIHQLYKDLLPILVYNHDHFFNTNRNEQYYYNKIFGLNK